MRSRFSRFAIGLGVIAVGALAIRLVFTLAIAPDLPVRADPLTYHWLGTNLADGLGYVRPPQAGAPGAALIPTAEFPPLFPALIAFSTLLGARSPTTQALATCFIGAGTVVLVGLLARRFADTLTALVAATLAAVHPLFFQPDGVLMSESLYMFLVAAVLLAALWVRTSPDPWWRWAVVGGLIGLAALTRTEALFLFPVLALPLAVARGGPTTAGRLRAIAAVTLASAAVVAPWTIRNAIEFGRFVPVSTNTGTVALGANCDATFGGDNLGSWEFRCVAATAAAYGDDGAPHAGRKNEAEVYDEWRRLGLEYAGDHAGELPKVVGARVLRTWGLYWEPGDQIGFDVAERRSDTLQHIGYWLAVALLPLVVVGVAASWRRRRAIGVLLAPVAIATLTSIIGFGSTRMRAIAEPALAVLAAAGITWLLARVQHRRRAEAATDSVNS